MRDIKFKGLTLDNKWVYGDLLQMTSKNEDTNEVIKATSIVTLDNNKTGNSVRPGVTIEIYESEINIVKSFTVGQFTGLTDKNGIDIYEGDIVDMYNSNCVHYNGVVIWNYGFSLAVRDKSGNNYIAPLSLKDNQFYIVKGNIHE